MELQQTLGLYRFKNFQLDVTERRFWCEDELIALTPKQFDLLLYFVEHAGSVAKKEELLDAVWTDSYVEESTLARNVSWLRKKLDKFAVDQPIIETVPKFGYRFTAEVTHTVPDENLLIIEEQILQHIKGEEIITIDDALAERNGNTTIRKNVESESENVNLIQPNTVASPRPYSSVSPFLLAAFALVAIAGIGFIVYQNYFQKHLTKAIVASRVVPFSGVNGFENSPAFSPDGKQFAYSWSSGKGDESDIYIKLIGAGEPLQLTKTKANEQYPTFSPDGKYIAFIHGKYGEPGEVIIIPALGGRERSVARLFSGNYSISYSPDGKHIAVIDTEDSTDGGQSAVYLVNIETGDRRRVTAQADFLSETTPRFSPDGKSIAFIRVFREDEHGRNIGKQDLFIVPTSGGEPHRLTSDGVIINSLTWSADGDYIYFVPVQPPNRTVVRRIPTVGGEQEIVSTGSENITNIDISPDGRTLVFAEDVRRWKIWLVTPDGQTGSKLIDSDFVEFFPQFSPDGSSIAFQTDRTGKSEIWTMDADGENLLQVTDTPFPSTSPQFSPDGSNIVFNQKNDEDFANYIVSANGGEPRSISPEGVQEDLPIWSADGKYIYFASNRSGTRNIWKTNADGKSEAIQITEKGGYRAMLSPDNKTVFFIKPDVPNQLWQIPAEGGEEKIIPEFEAAGFYSLWTIKNDGIYFLAANPDKSLKAKFYDFADKQIKETPGNYKIPPNLEGFHITIHENTLLCSIIEKSSRLMLADLQ